MHRNEKRAVAVVDGGSALCTGEMVVDGDDSDGADDDDGDDGADGDDGETVVNGGSAVRNIGLKFVKAPPSCYQRLKSYSSMEIENFW